MYLPAMPVIQSDLATTMQAVQWTIVAYFLAFGLAQLIYGPWADQAGRKPPMYAGLALFMIGTVICALAPTVEILIFGRFIQGIGGAANMVVLRAMIRDLATGADATRMMSTIMIVIAISPLLAPLSGSALMAFGSWRLVFWALLLAAGFSFFLIYFMVDETLPSENRQRFDLITHAQGLGRVVHRPRISGDDLPCRFCLCQLFRLYRLGVVCLYRAVRPEPDAVLAGLRTSMPAASLRPRSSPPPSAAALAQRR